MSASRPIKERFEEKYIPEPNSGCWLWTASIDRDGYGDIWHKTKLKAHRVSWELYRSKIPKDLQVLHRCDNPSCVNPDHLWLGTHSDNMADATRKSRRNQARSKNNASKLSEINVAEIVQSKEMGIILSQKFNVSSSNVSMIRSRKSWF